MPFGVHRHLAGYYGKRRVFLATVVSATIASDAHRAVADMMFTVNGPLPADHVEQELLAEVT